MPDMLQNEKQGVEDGRNCTKEPGNLGSTSSSVITTLRYAKFVYKLLNLHITFTITQATVTGL